MPRGHGRMESNFEHIERRRRTLLRRSLEQKNCQVVPKEPQISALILKNTDQRCIIFTLVALELDAYWKLGHGSEFRNYLQSGVSGVEDRESKSPPVIIFQVNLPEEQKINLPESASLQTSSVCSHSGETVMGRSRNRNKRTKSFSDFSMTSLPRCSEVDSSGSLCDSSGTVGSDILVTETSAMLERPQKRSSRKKGKKKRKQYKRSMRKNVTNGLEDQCEDISCCASIVENSVNSASVLLNEHISGNNLSQGTIFPRLSAEDTIIEQDDSEPNNDYVDSSATMLSCISCHDELDDSETIASISQGCVCDNSTSDLNCKSSATCPERIPYVDVITESTHPESKSNIDDNSISSTLDQYDDDPGMESFQDCWNGDISDCCNDVETKLRVKDKCNLSISRAMDSEMMKYVPPFCRNTVGSHVSDDGTINDCHAYGCLSEDVICTGNAERAECSSQASSSNVFHPVSSGKRGRTARKKTPRTGKDNNHPVLKKVQKMDTEHCVNIEKDAQANSCHVDYPSKYTDTKSRLDTSDGLKQNQRGKNGRYPCSYEMINQTSKSYSCKIASTAVESSEIYGKRKTSSSLKQVNHYSRKGFPNCNVVLSRPSKTNAQKDELRILPEVNEGKVDSSSGLTSPCITDSQLLMVKPIENSDICQSEQQQKNREYSDEGSLSENTCSRLGEMTSEVTDNQIDLTLTAALDSLGHTHMEVHSNIKDHISWHQDLSLMCCADGRRRDMQAECSHAERNELDSKFGTVLQKWVPVGRKETVVSCPNPKDAMKPSLIDGSVPNIVDSKNAEKEATRVHYFVPLTRRGSQCCNSSNAELNCLSLETDNFSGKLRYDPSTAGESVSMLEYSSHLSSEVQYQEFPKSESDLDTIIHAVNNASSSQTMAEAVKVSGTPIAEFERFISSASPVICQRSHASSCVTSFSKQLRNDSPCWHQNHNITLGSLWQWYEEPGCYGLEVKAEEKCHPRRLHNEILEFKAYFVPYLSAVQLFSRPGFSNACSNRETKLSHEADKAANACSNRETKLSHEADKAAKSSSELVSLPIFSKLLPQFRKEVDACILESSSSFKVELANQSVRNANLIDEELIFEYFEHAQPPQRRPLFEKIKELINGDKSSDSRIYGDPLKLECMNLCDLHPSSWYSVAWYPIYRIPEGNFRAAFLTYHSLGHFIHQSGSPNMADNFTHLVSPVVGLQSYNAKKECWFLPRISKFEKVHSEEILSSSTSKLVEERLRKLEDTASVMATATVCKGHQRCANNHPDYNHFFSRW